jgi:hypothetical protein
VAAIDIDGSGPAGVSPAAIFNVGQAAFVVGAQEGVEMTQSLALSAGVAYTLDADWSAQRDASFDNAEGGVFSFIVNGVAITTQAAGSVNNAAPVFGHLHAVYSPGTSGAYSVGFRVTRPYLGGPGTGAADVRDYIDNAVIAGGSAPCYANCDGSTAAPVLNVLDFTCFLQKFAAADPYANCDASTTTPTLNVLDFTCFLQKFAAGCP